jgi:hypothetical protein
VNSSLISSKQNLLPGKSADESLTTVKSRDPDELIGDGIGSVIIGDGFFMVAVILSAAHSSVSSLLWLSLLIPAFFFFGKGFADVFHARQIRRRITRNDLNDASNHLALSSPPTSAVDAFKESLSGEVVAMPSVTERTTRNLE